MMKNYYRNVFTAIITMMFMSIYTTVDGLFVAKVVSADAMAAINVSYPIINIMFTLSFGLAAGGCVRITHAIGEGNPLEANRRFTLTIGLGIVLSVIMIAFMGSSFDACLRFLGATDKIIDYCRIYGGIALLSYPIGITKEILVYVLRAQGMSEISMLSSVAGGIANIILDYLFIVVWQWGITGAALATSMGMLLTLLINIFFLAKRGNLRLCKPGKKIWKEALRISELGLTSGIFEFSYAVITWYFNHLSLLYYRENGIVAYTVIGYVQYALAAVFVGIGNGVSPMLSYYYGAKNKIENRRIINRTIKFTIIASAVVCVIGYWQAETLAGIFLKENTLPFMLAKQGIELISFSYLFMGMNTLFSCVLNAFEHGKLSAVLTVLRTVVFLVLAAALLTIYVGYKGMWIAFIAAEVMTLLLSILIYVHKIRTDGFSILK